MNILNIYDVKNVSNITDEIPDSKNTPLIFYSDVFWSYFINKYFESNAPRYYLAKYEGIECYGTTSTKFLKKDQKLIHLKDYFKENPDDKVNIENEEGYFGISYDYTHILESNLFHKRSDLRKSLETQILLSLLKIDENFKYENIFFLVEKDEIVSLSPTLSSKYSLMFLFEDNPLLKNKCKFCYQRSLSIPYEKPIQSCVVGDWSDSEEFSWKTNLDNIIAIIKKDLDVVKEFSEKLTYFIQEIESLDILFFPFDMMNKMDFKKFNETLKEECLDNAKNLKFIIEVLITLYEKDDLRDLTIKRYLELKEISLSKKEFFSLTMNQKLELISPSYMKVKHN